ncbi:hypothetical protein DL768_006411 [Monosporascus sp. mg162]|nr:hypothetical protein DL768_006411 [Monosporascus sp. mg162]
MLSYQHDQDPCPPLGEGEIEDWTEEWPEGDDYDDDSSEDECFGERERKYVEDDGGWYRHLKQYAIFWPYIWPARNFKFQLYLWILVASTLAERALNILYPRQLGIVIDKLYDGLTTGVVPWKEILLWILYATLGSQSCGLPALGEVLESRLSNWSRFQLSVAAFDHIMSLPMGFHDSKDSGEVIKAVEQAGALASILKTILLETLPFVLDMVAACWYVTYLLDAYAAVIVIFVGVSFGFVTYYITIIMMKARREVATQGRAESRKLYETVSNWATVAFFNRAKYERFRLTQTVERSVKASQWDIDVSSIMFACQEICEILGRLMISILAAFRIVRGHMPVGNFVALESYWDTITTPLWMLGHTYRQISSDLVDAERLLQLFKTKSDVIDAPGARPIQIPAGNVEFSDVSFGYHKSNTTVDAISFVAQPGQTVALVGETGSGKSTILKLLMRFYDVQKGCIKIDGQDIRDVTLDSVREAFGFVPQAAALFNTSILDNVKYGRLDATDEEVYNACKAASIHDKILTFPHGYHTKVGERGVKLSGGELQRLAIARVILKNPRIVLLDEATSALDTETESKIQNALRQLTLGIQEIFQGQRLAHIAPRPATPSSVIVSAKGEPQKHRVHRVVPFGLALRVLIAAPRLSINAPDGFQFA